MGRLTLPALLICGVLSACASDREQQAFSAWEAANITFRPTDDDLAPINSGTGLRDYIERALRRNPGLRSEGHSWRAALERIPQVRSLPDPRLTYGGFLESVETRTGPQRHRIGLTQMIPWPGKLIHAAGVAVELATARRARYERTRLAVVAGVSVAYANYYYLGQDLRITKEMLALIKSWEGVAQARLRAGVRAAHRDVIKAQVELGRLQDRLQTVRDARRPFTAKLNALLDQPAETLLPWPAQLPDAKLDRSDKEILALLPKGSPELRELEHRTAARRRGVDLAYQSYLPDFMLGFDFIEVGSARMSGTRGSGDDPLLAKFGLSLPIWFGRYGASVNEARAKVRAAEGKWKQKHNMLQADVSQSLFAYRDAVRKIRLYRDWLVPRAKQSLKAMARAYEAGKGSFLDLLDAERVLLQFHLSHERAKANRVIGLAVLEQLTGTKLTASGKEGGK